MTNHSLFETPARSERINSVSDLNQAVARVLEQNFPLCWVSGEISNLTRAASGHWYFTLKDQDAQVRAVMFRGRAQYVSFMPREGDKVEVRALVSLYGPRGDFQINVESMRRAGLGSLYEEFLRLKAKLEAEGLFDPERKQPLPRFPRTIGIITSPQAAALQDVLTTLERRAPYATIILYPTLVQGIEAKSQIVEAIANANRDAQADVLLLCRGGGSLEDLWCFNEAIVVRAIAASQLPIIAGIGHETDTTLADLAADVRAPTPTAAAELVAPDKTRLLQQLSQHRQRLHQVVSRRIDDAWMRLDSYSARLRSPAALMERQAERISQLETRLGLWSRRALDRQQRHLTELSLRLQALDPNQPLLRGYALVTDANGHLVDSILKAPPASLVHLRLADGQLSAVVESTTANT